MNFQAALAGNNVRSRWASYEAQGNQGWKLFLKGLLLLTPLICARQLPDAGSMLAGTFSCTTLLLMKQVIPSQTLGMSSASSYGASCLPREQGHLTQGSRSLSLPFASSC